MTVLLIAGSPSAPSRSAVLLDAVAARLAERKVPVDRLAIRELAAHALLLGEASNPSVQQAVEQVQRADVIVIATPVYKAAYSGVLKVFLDLLPQSALKGKTVLPLATGGSPHHMLALDYALRPVLQSLAARHILPGVYATDGQVTLQPEGAYQLQAELSQRLDDAVETLASEGLKLPPTWGFEPVAFSRVRCSV
ncbi:NADPH-dependent FMN reductase [Variovorax sp. J2P1-59]|uniref:NADPH-dependent FMN reductase n=1 Tax=Variovorax flavidus TaxID=3053501 RepID=UPI002574EBAE|nr:NADPH-dependent FMN reductase [Variovorax sp. J2P1-59]MDM0073591.1 NADPH-dependent FMN reductase [Variovorax sp. J2P1-59]